jgi:hypothetical protein
MMNALLFCISMIAMVYLTLWVVSAVDNMQERKIAGMRLAQTKTGGINCGNRN